MYLGFNVAHIGTGFIYLSQADILERPQEEEAALLEDHQKTPYFWLGLGTLCFVCGRHNRMDGTLGRLEWFLASVRKFWGHDRVWEPFDRELVFVLVEHR